jgi:hypothetical protein
VFQPSLALVRERIAKGYWTDGVGAQPEPNQPASAEFGVGDGGGLPAQLKQLAELHAAGALNDDEFQQAKQKLLG